MQDRSRDDHKGCLQFLVGILRKKQKALVFRDQGLLETVIIIVRAELVSDATPNLCRIDFFVGV